jgi:hypothetical protein
MLYHGTNGAWLPNLLRRGIEPRGDRVARDNWRHVAHRSNPRCVYLTDSYAPYFAFNAARGANPTCAVLEVDVDLLDSERMFPDEDFLEQAGRRVDSVPGTMSQRTLHYRRLQFGGHGLAATDTKRELGWRDSLRHLGTASHHGTVSPDAIVRTVSWPHAPNAWLALVWDPTITILNQRFCGDRYRALTARLFGDPVPADLSDWDRRSVESFDPTTIVGLERRDLRTRVAA